MRKIKLEIHASMTWFYEHICSFPCQKEHAEHNIKGFD